MRLPSTKTIALSVAGVVLTYVLTYYTMPYQFGIVIAFPQVGVLLAACAGGPLWGVLAGAVGGLAFYYSGAGTIWLYELIPLGLGAGLLAYRFRAFAASMLSWVTLGVMFSYYAYSQESQTSQALYSWLITGSYEVAIAAVVVDVVLTLLHISRVRPKKAAAEKETARSEAQTEIGL